MDMETKVDIQHIEDPIQVIWSQTKMCFGDMYVVGFFIFIRKFVDIKFFSCLFTILQK